MDAPLPVGAKSGRRVKLIHVLNAYAIKGDNNDGPASPFDQLSTIKSIERARRLRPPDLKVDFVCAVFESDRQALSDLPCRKVILRRSTRSEYEFIQPSKELPFLQDIINAAIADEDRDADFFLMLTNSDIGLTKYFYKHLRPKLESREALSINRLTIPMTNVTTKITNAAAFLAQVDSNLELGEKHPGYDCFIIHSSVLKAINLGEMFAGYPPWGSVFHQVLKVMALNYTNFESNVQGTFHLGDDGSKWKKSNTALSTELKEKYSDDVKRCPKKIFGDHPYTYLNTANCGKWFRSDRLLKNQSIPSFVQLGYEATYLRRYLRKYGAPPNIS